ncbi:MAG: VWA domain-containing protein [Kiritimatiellaeota bacterium]|nr:VWA domain-containing protein [Kiritimatiellota bacterium]
MTFLQPIMLFGLIGVFAPVLIHLLNRRRARVVSWGAMRFLLASMAARNHRILLEELLLLLVRCLVVALLVFAMARPLLASASSVPWPVVLVCGAASLIALGSAGAFWSFPVRRALFLAASAFFLAVAVTAGVADEWFRRQSHMPVGGRRDVIFVLDASRSMSLTPAGGGRSNYSRAVDELRATAADMRPGDAAGLIQAGPAPRALVSRPTYDRADLAAVIRDLKEPVGGRMDVPQALLAALAALENGRNASREIVMFTDGQRNGWQIDSDETWRFLERRFAALPLRPRLLVRRLPPPRIVRNLTLADLTFSRRVIGTDREVGITAKVTNTGTVPVRPAAIELSVGGTTVARKLFRTSLPAGVAQSVELRYRFLTPGRFVVSARVAAADDLSADDTCRRVVRVLDVLPVLLVESAAGTRPLAGAADYMAVALRPGPGVASRRSAGLDGSGGGGRSVRTLVRPTVLSAGAFTQLGDLGPWPVVILAGVRALPDAAARRLAAHVRRGAGLLIVPGPQLDSAFYNAWYTPAGEAVCPARFRGAQRLLDRQRAALLPESMNHPALRFLRQALEADARAVTVSRWWRLEVDDRAGSARIGARLDNGAPFLVEKNLGRGRVILTACALNPSATSLPLHPSFVPTMDGLVGALGAAAGTPPNVRPGTEVVFILRPGSRGKSTTRGSGLFGEYFEGTEFQQSRLMRVDPTVDFEWGAGAPAPGVPADRFSVRWTGWIEAAFRGPTTFHTVVDDGVRLWVGGRRIINEWSDHYPTEFKASVSLEPGRRYPIQLEYYENSGEAEIRLRWSGEGQAPVPIPSTALYAAPGPGAMVPATAAAGASFSTKAVSVLTPFGEKKPARVKAVGGDLRIAFSETTAPGLYRLRLAKRASVYDIGSQPNADSAELPFVVTESAAESVLTPLTEADRRKIEARVPVLWADSLEDLDAAMAGDVRGTDFTDYAAAAVLLLLIAEIALSRWSTAQRRLHKLPDPRSTVSGGTAAEFGAGL